MANLLPIPQNVKNIFIAWAILTINLAAMLDCKAFFKKCYAFMQVYLATMFS